MNGNPWVAVWGPQKWALDRYLTLEESGVDASYVGNGRARDIYPIHSAILLLDGPAGPAVELLRRLASASVAPRVVLLVRKARPQQIIEALALGISGCAPASIDQTSLMTMVRRVNDGGLVVEPMLAALMWEAAQRRRPSTASPLSIREELVLALLSRGLTNLSIARRLGLSLATVRTHLQHIYAKLEAANRVEAVARAVAGGLL